MPTIPAPTALAPPRPTRASVITYAAPHASGRANIVEALKDDPDLLTDLKPESMPEAFTAPVTDASIAEAIEPVMWLYEPSALKSRRGFGAGQHVRCAHARRCAVASADGVSERRAELDSFHDVDHVLDKVICGAGVGKNSRMYAESGIETDSVDDDRKTDASTLKGIDKGNAC